MPTTHMLTAFWSMRRNACSSLCLSAALSSGSILLLGLLFYFALSIPPAADSSDSPQRLLSPFPLISALCESAPSALFVPSLPQVRLHTLRACVCNDPRPRAPSKNGVFYFYFGIVDRGLRSRQSWLNQGPYDHINLRQSTHQQNGLSSPFGRGPLVGFSG